MGSLSSGSSMLAVIWATSVEHPQGGDRAYTATPISAGLYIRDKATRESKLKH